MPVLLKPHTSLTYVRIGRIIVSNMSNNILGGKDCMNFNFRFMLKTALRDLSEINPELLEYISWPTLLIDQTITPRYLYWLTCSMGFPLKNTFKFSSVPKHIDLILSSFTIILLFEQNFNRPFNCFCKPVGVSENKIRSLPHKMWATISFDMAMPTSADKYVLRSNMYLRNINPLEIPPWLTPKLFRTALLSLPLRLTWKWVLP